jgi:hypothetical protein
MMESNVISLSEEKFSSLLEFDLETFYSLFDGRGLIFFPNGSVATKPELMEKLKSQETVFRGVEMHKILARSYGNTTVVQGEGFFNIKLQDVEFNEVLTFIDVWVEKEGEWKLVSAHFVKMG